MSDQTDGNQDKLTQKFQNSSLNDASQQNVEQQSYQNGYNPVNASTFVPQQNYYQGGYQGYGAYNPQNSYGAYNQQDVYLNYNTQGTYNGYGNTRGGYNNQGNRAGYSAYGNRGYNSFEATQQPQQPQGMSLADFQKQKSASSIPATKPKKTLKLAGSKGITLANAKKVPQKEKALETENKTEEKSEEKPEKSTKEEASSDTATTAATDVKISSKENSSQLEEGKPLSSTSKEAGSELKTERTKTPTPSSGIAAAEPLVKDQEDEVDEEVVKDLFGGKDHVSIIFMGHVDAGKSTMGGNILYMTGSVDKRTVEKYEREAKDAGRQGWYLSWVMDTNKEERNDGKTIEVGRAYFETDKRRYTILDAPGHKMYVSEMIGGASQADVGILVISARKGEYETGFEKGGQTREHALLAKTQGVNKIIVVVNKMDDPTVNWSQDRYKDCTTKLGMFLKGIGYSKEDVTFMPVSGYTGAGLKDRVNPKDCPWYKGPSLLEYLDNMKTVDRHINAPFMLPVSGKMKDMGTIVEGKIESGHIKKGSKLLMMPNKDSIEVIVIYNETEQECDAAYCGEQVRLKIKGVEEEDIQPGYVLTSPQFPVKTVTKFEAVIAIVELKSILSNGFSCVMHLHAAIEEVTFVELKHKFKKGTNKKSKEPPAFAKKGMKIVAVLETNEPICAETYKEYPQLGRFTLRDQGATIAIGKITKLL
ncbi:uncharacterized protein PRCAT00005456001 [Priceomyces carsonii]|uniref:uncharacterized protein n=1 Tax=Priceomyces carsonii TaxID=28549 RepID=UPI002ED9D582|nr:unnamed protein product [Priceomyces carsonii]